MSDSHNQLLLAALQRAGKAQSSEDLLDAATGLALAEGWQPEQLRNLTRRSVAKRLQNMQASELVLQQGEGLDETARRLTPLFVPVGGYNLRAPVPAPPTEARPGREAPYDGMDRTQLLAVLDVHDSLAECLGRFLTDLNSTREKARQRLQAVGLGSR